MKKMITEVAWFQHSGSSFGIIICQYSQQEPRAFIGVVAGVDETKDMINIAQYGAKFPLEAAKIVMKEKGMKLITSIPV